MDVQTTECVACGAQEAADAARCTTCSASLLVDIVPAELPPDPKARYALARALAAVPGAPPFPALRPQLDAPGSPVVSGVTRAQAAVFDAVFAKHDVLPLLQPVAAHQPRPRRNLYIAAAVVVAAAAAFVTVRSARNLVAEKEAAGRVFTKTLLKSIAIARCGKEPRGTAFFIQPGRLLGSIQAICDDDGPTIELSDARELTSRLVRSDNRLGIAVLEVDDAREVASLSLGDATSLKVDDKVILLHANDSAPPEAHEVKVANVTGRPNQLDSFTFRLPKLAREGDVLVDNAGKIVAIVRNPDLSGGMSALPINFVYDDSQSGGAALVENGAPPGLARWGTYGREIADDAAARARDLVAKLEQRPGLTGAGVYRSRPDVLRATLVQRFPEHIDPREQQFEIRMNGSTVCYGTFDPGARVNPLGDNEGLRSIPEFGVQGWKIWKWLDAHGQNDHVYVTPYYSRKSVESCIAGRRGLMVRLMGGAEDLDRQPLDVFNGL